MSSRHLDDQSFEWIRRLMQERAGIRVSQDRRAVVEMRLLGVLARRGVDDPLDWLRKGLSGKDDQIAETVVQALLIGETYFFRDTRCFQALRKNVFPDLIEQRRREKTLSVWCAACSTGQEVWSISMLLRDAFPELSSWNLHLLGTDLCEEAIARARAGTYTQFETNRGLPARFLTRFFIQDGPFWSVRDDLKQGVEFRTLNLARPLPPLPRFDLVLLRNVLIYMPPEVRGEVVGRIAAQLTAQGRLVLGHAETLPAGIESLERVGDGSSRTYRPCAGTPLHPGAGGRR